MTISKKISENLTHSSWIRKMFETGARLKKQYGAENVYDFSLGNPDLPSPQEFNSALIEEAKIQGSFVHGYMPNNGYPETRQAVAEMLKQENNIEFTEDNIIITVGAAGALNVILKSILDQGDEVIVIAPYFVEYDFYIDNHQGKIIVAETTDELLPDLQDLSNKITAKTKAVIINSPNNPTGRVYTESLLTQLGELLQKKSKALGNSIYLLADEPYKKILYDDAKYFSPFQVYNNAIVISSFSKDLSLAGERIGYIAVSPKCEYVKQLTGAATFCNRILGFVNAPALMQRVIKKVLNANVDISIYQKRRDLLYDALTKIGYEINIPEGAFYMFPKSPISNDIEFVNLLQKELILTTPGTGFHCSGYFRISYCVGEETIEGAIPGFEKVYKSI